MSLTDQFDSAVEEGLEDVQFSFSGMPIALESAVTEKYIYLAVEKTWGDVRIRPSTDELKQGHTFVPPIGMEVVIAFPRPGTEDIEEELKEGAITFDEFRQIIQNQLIAFFLLGHEVERQKQALMQELQSKSKGAF